MENYNMVYEEQMNEDSFDDDRDADFYDIMRDDSGCELWTDLIKLKKFYVDKPTGLLIYFKGNEEKFWESIKSTAEYELSELKKKKGDKNGK